MLSLVSGTLYMFRTRHRLTSSLGPSQLHMVGAISFGNEQSTTQQLRQLRQVGRDPPRFLLGGQPGLALARRLVSFSGHSCSASP